MTLVEHARFFARLVELVPARYYLPNDGEVTNLKYMKKSLRDEVKAKFKQQYKQNKRSKLDPEQAKTTLELQQESRRTTAEEGIMGASASAPGRGGGAASGADDSTRRGASFKLPSGGAAPSREELRARLQQKLQMLRQQRKADEQEAAAQEAGNWREKTLSKSRTAAKTKRKLQAISKSSEQARAAPAPEPAPQPRPVTAEEAGTIAFNRLDLGTGSNRNKKSWLNRRALLAKAEAKQGTERSEQERNEDAWKGAHAKATGVKVLDDPKLLRKSLKREQKTKAKRAKAWQERVEKQSEEQSARQEKRSEHINARKSAKKGNKIARRENKLSRAGFEGRTQKFITP